MPTFKFNATRRTNRPGWIVTDNTRSWIVTYDPWGKPTINNAATGRPLNPYGPTGTPILNAVRRALETEHNK